MFDPSFLEFFKSLARNNNRDWFNEHKSDYKKNVVEPLCVFIDEMAPRLNKISKNFNAVELVGLREMMLHRQYDKIDQYEKEWRLKHNIPEGEPSTLVPKKKNKIKNEIRLS